MPRLAKTRAIAQAALAAMLLASALTPAWTQASPKDAELPITKVALFSSGVGYFEHKGKVSGDSIVRLSFRAEEVNDALKSLIVRDGTGASAGAPTISYPSPDSLDRPVSGLLIDLTGAPAVAKTFPLFAF